MGMFDYVTCKAPLPRASMQHREFQTQSLENFMYSYIITEDGRLMLELREMVENAESPLGFYLEKTGELEDTEYHGDIVFCDFEREHDSFSDLIEFRARFTDGQLQWIKELPQRSA